MTWQETDFPPRLTDAGVWRMLAWACYRGSRSAVLARSCCSGSVSEGPAELCEHRQHCLAWGWGSLHNLLVARAAVLLAWLLFCWHLYFWLEVSEVWDWALSSRTRCSILSFDNFSTLYCAFPNAQNFKKNKRKSPPSSQLFCMNW